MYEIIITCSNCNTKYSVEKNLLKDGQKMQCCVCFDIWIYKEKEYDDFAQKIQDEVKNAYKAPSASSFYIPHLPNEESMVETEIKNEKKQNIRLVKKSKTLKFLKLLAWPLFFAAVINIIFWAIYLTNYFPELKTFVLKNFF